VTDRPLRAAIVTIRFPVPSEAFASVEILELIRSGASIDVLAMRGADANHGQMLGERGLENVRLDVANGANTIEGLGYTLRRPTRALRLLGFIARHASRHPTHLLRSLALVPSTMRCFERIQMSAPDVVHLFWGHFPSLVGFLVHRYRPDIVLSHFLGAYDLEYDYGPAAAVARDADVVWTHAKVNVPLLEARGIAPSRIRVSYRGVDTRGIPPAPPAKRPHRVITAGRFLPTKAFDAVLEVFAAVRTRIPDATLVVAGDGPERPRLERVARQLGVADAVEFVGHVPQMRLFALFDESEILLLMSRDPTERLPNVAKEAALRWCVTVTSQTTGIDELFTDGKDALIVSGRDVGAAAEGIVALFEDPKRRARMAESARDRVLGLFDVRATAGRYLDEWRAQRERKRGRSSQPAGATGA
jgi:glycosyltransferase involved in cell wall biosynthesis